MLFILIILIKEKVSKKISSLAKRLVTTAARKKVM
jgi:hypothetical protein